MSSPNSVLSQLMQVIADRRVTRPPKSYTTKLFDAGMETIVAKVREEVDELAAAAQSADPVPREVVHEAADLIYHLLVLLAACDVGLGDVEVELTRRFGTSGLDEKASRAS